MKECSQYFHYFRTSFAVWMIIRYSIVKAILAILCESLAVCKHFFRLAWQALGSMTREEAQQKFIDQLSDLVPAFRPYVEALWADKLEKERLALVPSHNFVCVVLIDCKLYAKEVVGDVYEV